jgi:putative ABC transport system permease protein
MTTQTNTFGASIGQMTLMGLRYLSGRKLRTTLTTLAIVFGVSLIFAINLTLPSVLDIFKQSLSPIAGADISITSATHESFAPGDALTRAEAVDGVKAVSGILRRQFSIPGRTEQIDLVGLDPDSIQQVRQFAMSEGRFLQADDSGAAVLPARLAELDSNIQVGKTFPLVTAGGIKVYKIVGLLADTGSSYESEILVNLPDAQKAFNQPGLINTIEVSIDVGADRAAVSTAVQAALGDGFQLDTTSNAADSFAATQLGLTILNLLGVLALFLGAFLIFNTFRTVVVERRRDLGMLRTIGATRRQITLLVLIESLIQGIVGTLIGLVVGYLMAGAMTAGMNQIMSTYLGNVNIQLQLSASAVGGAVILGMLTALLAGYLPARAAGRTSPLEALRPASTASVKRAARWSLIAGIVAMVVAVGLLASGSRGAIGGALLFLIGVLIASPSLVIPMARLFSPLLALWFAREGDLARGNLVRQPGRAAITGSTLMIGLAVLVLMAATVSALGDLIQNLANHNFSSDVILVPQAIGVYNKVIGADESLATRLKALPEVDAVGSLRYAASNSGGQALEVMGIDPNDYPKVASFEFTQGEPEAAFAALGGGRNAILTGLAVNTLKVNIGEDVTLQTADGPQTYHVVGVANDILTFKVVAVFISQANMAADFHKSEDIMLMLNLKPGADKEAALADVQNIAKDYPQFTPHLTGEYRDELTQTTTKAFVVLYGLAFLILIPAALGLLNTLTINVLERTREIGVVRAVGGSRKQVRRIVTGEALLLGIFGSALGVLAGVAISYGFIAAFGTIGWNAPYSFPLIGIIAAVIIGMMLALFAGILPARSAAKLDIIRALQYE